MWGNFREKLSGKSKIIFLDCEALGLSGSTKSNDAKVFALILLISSLLIFNTMSNPDENGLSELALITELANSIGLNVFINNKLHIVQSRQRSFHY
jgi:hypothetical protein